MKKRMTILLGATIGCLLAAQSQTLSLDSCRRLAIDRNKSLQMASEKERKAHYEKKAAFTHYLPDFSLTGSYLRNEKNLSLLGEDKYLPIGTLMEDGSFGFRPDQVKGAYLPNGQWAPVDANGNPFDPKLNPEKIVWNDYTTIPKSEFEMDVKNVWVGVFSVVQPVFMGGKIAAYNKIAGYAKELATSQKDTELQNVILQTDEAYWQTVSLVNKSRLTSSYVALLRQMDSDVQELMAEGLATKADGLTVKVKLNEAEMAETRVENGLRLSRMSLARICGLPLDTVFVLADEAAEELHLNMEAVAADVEQAYLERPELRSLNLAAKIYEKKEAVVRSEMLPKVALTANYMISNPNMFNGLEHKFGGMWNVGVAVNVPLFHWGERFHNLNAAKAETRIKRLELEEAREKVELQIHQSVFRLNEAEKSVATAQRNKESAAENLYYANTGFEEGVIPISQVMEAQTAWLRANSELIDAQIDAKLARVYLKKATGNIRY